MKTASSLQPYPFPSPLNLPSDRADARIRIDGMDHMFRSYVEQWVDYLRGESSSPRTVNTYTEGVMRFWQFLNSTGRHGAADPLEVTSADMTAFKLWMSNTIDAKTGRTYSEATQANRWRSVQAFYSWIVKIKRELPESPLANLKPPRITRTPPPTLSVDSITTMVRTCSNYIHDFRDGRDRALLLLFFDCGPRLSEVANMRLEDWDPGTSQIRILGKGRKQRALTLGATSRDALLSYLRRNRPNHKGVKTPWLWLGVSNRRGEDGWRLTDSGIYQALKYRAELVGIKDFHPHILRHTSASIAKALGMRPEAMMANFGWETDTMYRWYGSADDARRASDEQRRLSPADRLEL